MPAGVVLFEEEQLQIQRICERLAAEVKASSVFILNKDGQEIARTRSQLEAELLPDMNAASVWMLAQKEFAGPLLPDTSRVFRFSVVADRAVLVIAWESGPPAEINRSIERACADLTEVFAKLTKKMRGVGGTGSHDPGSGRN